MVIILTYLLTCRNLDLIGKHRLLEPEVEKLSYINLLLSFFLF